MLEKTDKSKELAERVSVAILECLQEHCEDISNIDCITGVLMGATAIVSTVHRSMDEDHYDEMTAAILVEWAACVKKVLENPNF